MSWRHIEKRVISDDMDARIARIVMRKLRAENVAVTWFDRRDVHGARLHPANLLCGHAWVICRAVSSKLSPTEYRWAREHAAFIQLGSSDISELLAHVARVNKTHWNA